MAPNYPASDESEQSLTEDPRIHTAVIINLLAFSLLILMGNSLTALSILCFTKSRTTVGIIISCISLAEIINVLGPNLIAMYVYLTDKNLGQSTLCKVQGYFSTAMRLATTSLICLLCVDRTLAVFARHFHQRQWREVLLKIALSSVWIFSGFAAAWPLLGFGDYSPATEATNIYCFFSYTDSFAIFVACFLLLQLVFIIASSCVLVFRSPGHSFETNFSVSNGKFIMNNRLHNPARHLHQRTLARMCGLVAGLYSLCYLPWNIIVCLSLASVGYPELLSLMCLTLPLVSGLFSPLLYSLLWSPYRRAYFRALTWPGYKCRALLGHGEDHSSPLNATAPGRSRTYSFWSADNFIDEDLNPPENAFDVLFGPTSLAKPLEFNVHELQMFEKEQEDANPNGIVITLSDDVTQPNDDVKYSDNITSPSGDFVRSDDVTSQNNDVVEEESVQFQSILDLIDELTDRKETQQSIANGGSSKVKRSKSNISLLRGLVPFRSADAASPAPAPHELYLDDIGRYIKNETSAEPAGRLRRSVRRQPKSHLPQEQFWLKRLGRSQAWSVDARPRYLDYLVAERVKEYTNASDQPFVIDI